MRQKVLCVAGARPNFIKIAPLMRALSAHPTLTTRLLHTGQHYDERLSKVFFDELKIPRPDLELDIGSGSHAIQTAEIMRRFESVLDTEQPEAVLVVGDVNSTIGCALVAAKFHLRQPFRCRFGERRRPLIVHVEAGLRSFDDDMPEEINRRLTDVLSDVLYVSDPVGVDNLEREGICKDRVFFVGNVVIDTLLAAKVQAMSSPILATLGVEEKQYGLVTLHRPSNVDDPDLLGSLVDVLAEIGARLPLVFPVHPRTRTRFEKGALSLEKHRITLCDPLGYLDFLRLQSAARVVLTDSGGVQEETTVLGVPCVTLRENTERPCTISEGTNFLAGTSRAGILRAFEEAMAHPSTTRIPKLWDGRSAERIAASLASILGP
jgi:UDP-N-acetylglucosamine 2-epimerase (non-hydrolysing)